jgi:CheY-like chemotaxis protein
MENIPDILQGVAALTWPIIIIIVILLFRANVRELIESAKSRKFTVKVAGNELTMDEISEQQRNLISDLQEQLVELQKQVDSIVKSEQTMSLPTAKEAEEAPSVANHILWVDDNPKNNAFLIESFEGQGISVVTATSTEDALRNFNRRIFDRVITDMGRLEGKQFNPQAGLELIRQIRLIDNEIPIIMYTSSRSAREQRSVVLDAGATNITASPTELLNSLNLGTGFRSAYR